jgi:hypothetical protein
LPVPTKATLAAAKGRGVASGNPKLAKTRKSAVATIKALADQHAANVLTVSQIRRAGTTSLHGRIERWGHHHPRAGRAMVSSVKNVLEHAYGAGGFTRLF